jgi:hypothetical protein
MRPITRTLGRNRRRRCSRLRRLGNPIIKRRTATTTRISARAVTVAVAGTGPSRRDGRHGDYLDWFGGGDLGFHGLGDDFFGGCGGCARGAAFYAWWSGDLAGFFV